MHRLHAKPTNPWELSAEATSFRNEWLERQIRKVFTDEEVQQVLTNRRSVNTDEALIEDFMRGDFDPHTIPKDWNFTTAIDAVTEQFRPNRVLHPVSYPDIRYYPVHLKPSAETPWTDPTFRFKPTGRDVDIETDVPKLFETITAKLPKCEGKVLVKDYLEMKQKLGLIEDSSTSYHNLYNEILNYNRPLIHLIKEGAPPFWTPDGKPIPYMWNTLHARSHVVSQDEPDKIRSVFGATKLLLATELTFIWPLQATYLNTDAGRMLWGREIIKGGWKKLFQEMHAQGAPNSVLGADWSQFDKRLLHALIRIVHQIWRSYFDFTKYERTSKYPNADPKDPRRIERLWEWMCHSITGTPILLPNGQLFEWMHTGFGSGYQQTQLMDTFCNAIMVYTCLLSLGVNVNAPGFWARFQGDDSIIRFFERMFTLYGATFLDMFADSAKYYFNGKLNIKKSDFSDRVTGQSVLSYKNWFGLPTRTDEDLLRHLFFPERPQDLGRLAASAVGLAQAAAGESERFHRLCEMIWYKLVIRKGVTPKWKALTWMVRAGMFETLDQLKTAEFPSRISLMANAFQYKRKTEASKQHQWPTQAGPRGKFYFLDSL